MKTRLVQDQDYRGNFMLTTLYYYLSVGLVRIGFFDACCRFIVPNDLIQSQGQFLV